jgi:adenine-specific DNA-methyltransferase
MEQLKLHTPDLTKANVEKLASLFPQCVVEAVDENGKLVRRIDFDLLRQELSDRIVEGPAERYRLDWPGKREALLAANAPIAKTLRPFRDESVDFDATRNLFIEGDNLDALKLLQETYLNKVKLIYIDPPYNTGNDFIYNDDFAESTDAYFRRSNQVDEGGRRLVSNSDTNGRFHSDWLSMMYPRIRLARNLLRDDGTIFVSIDDGEVRNLRAILDEVFGAENFVATIIWQKVFSPKNSARHFSEDHDYILVYARNAAIWVPKLLPRSEEMEARYDNPDNDPRGPWTSGDLAARNFYGEGTYSITCPSGRIIDGPPPGTYWRYAKHNFLDLDKDGRIWWGKDGNNVPRLKRFLSDVKQGRVPQTFWPYGEVGHTQEAKKELLSLVAFPNSDSVFDTPKPTRLLRRMLQVATNPTSNDIVLDFFAGSGSTMDAIFSQNREDSGNRRCILVQLPEPVNGMKGNIADIAKERIRNAGIKQKGNLERTSEEKKLDLLSVSSSAQDTSSLDTGFRVLKVDSSNMHDIYYRPDEMRQEGLLDSIDNIKPDRTADDLLFQVLIDWGVDLSLPIRRDTLEGKTVAFVDENALAACFDRDVTEELERYPIKLNRFPRGNPRKAWTSAIHLDRIPL